MCDNRFFFFLNIIPITFFHFHSLQITCNIPSLFSVGQLQPIPNYTCQTCHLGVLCYRNLFLANLNKSSWALYLYFDINSIFIYIPLSKHISKYHLFISISHRAGTLLQPKQPQLCVWHTAIIHQNTDNFILYILFKILNRNLHFKTFNSTVSEHYQACFLFYNIL